MARDQHTRDEWVAIHEAGHVVADFLQGRETIKEATIVPDSDRGSAGHVEHEAMSREDLVRVDCPRFDEPEDRHVVERYIIGALAGEAATFILSGARDPEGAGRCPGENISGDTKNAWELAYRFYEIGEDPGDTISKEAYAFMDWLWWRTVNLLSDQIAWKAVQNIARCLMSEKTLSGQRCREIYHETVQSFVPKTDLVMTVEETDDPEIKRLVWRPAD